VNIANFQFMDDTNNLDRVDLKLLAQLQRDASLSNLELAERVGLSPTPCARRVKRLITDGFIERQVAVLNAEKLGYDLTAHVSISMDRHTPDRFENFEAEIARYDEVVDCSVVTGQSADYLIRVVVKDMKHFEAVLLGKLTRIPGVTGGALKFRVEKGNQPDRDSANLSARRRTTIPPHPPLCSYALALYPPKRPLS
jgi:Lrp/AsnC family leucine-responsive transcriptional regulator